MHLFEKRVITLTATPNDLRILADVAETFGSDIEIGDSTILPQPLASFDDTELKLSLGGDYKHDPLDQKVQLHERICILYIVDGYEAQYMAQDGHHVIAKAEGQTIFQALINLNRIIQKPVKGRLPDKIRRCPGCGATAIEKLASEFSALRKYICKTCDLEHYIKGN